jgi:hypothetical protein
MIFWTTGNAPLRSGPSLKHMLMRHIPPGVLVEGLGGYVPWKERGWVEVLYKTGFAEYRGWCYGAYLEEYHPVGTENVVPLPEQTLNPHDAKQYIIWKGQPQYNMCGEICVAHIAEDSLASVLTKWEQGFPNVFRRVFKYGKATGTGIPDLASLLSIYEMDWMDLAAFLYDSVLNRPVLTPGQMEKALNLGRPIVGVKISAQDGELRQIGTLHWVVVESVKSYGINSGAVEIFNPFMNRYEKYSWREFQRSMGVPYGMIVHF